MRIDILLNKLCLVKTRSIAKKACDKNLVLVNEKIIKSSHNVNVGDLIEFSVYGYKMRFQLEKMIEGNVSKKDAPDYYKILSREKIEIDEV